MDYWFNKTLKDVGIDKISREGSHSMRSIRCYIATKFIMLRAEYYEMGWKPEPLNPLQHVKPKMTEEVYADK